VRPRSGRSHSSARLTGSLAAGQPADGRRPRSSWDLNLWSATRELDHSHEEVVDLPHHTQEAIEVDRLGDIRGRVQVVAADDVLLGVRGGQNDDGDTLQLRVRLDLGQHFMPGLSWQIEVEQDEVRARRLGEVSFAAQEAQGSLAVSDDTELVLHLVLGERLTSDQDVARVVFDEQYLDHDSRNTGAQLTSSCPSASGSVH